MDNKKFKPIIIIAQLIFIAVYCLIVFHKAPVSYEFGPEDFVYDAGVLLEDGVYVSEDADAQGIGVLTTPVVLPKGTYDVNFYYEATGSDNVYSFLRSGYPYFGLEYDQNIYLNSNSNVQNAYLNVLTETEEFQARILYQNDGELLVKGVEIIRNHNAEMTALFKWALFFCAFDIILFSYLHFKKNGNNNMVLPVILVGIIAGIPLYANYIINAEGHDLIFHLMRIEGVKDALLSGQFPVRIHPTQFDGYGYATGVYYPELFLYIPALLRIIGFPILDAYQIFIFIQNIITAIVSYVCFKTISRDEKLGLLGCALYTLSLYRMINVYYRSAVGESLAMIFIPMVFLGLYLIITLRDKLRWSGILALTAGMTGIIQSHILSCEMVGLMCVLFGIIYMKRIFTHKRWLDLLISGVLTLGLNLWFLLPFIQYMRLNVWIRHWEIRDIAVNALNPVQIFFPFPRATGITELLPEGISNEMPFGIGFPLVLGILFILSGFFVWIKKEWESKNTFGVVCFVMGILCLWMTTYLFPWTVVDEIGGLVAKVMNMVQFPWRYLGLATFFFTCATVFYLCCVPKDELRKKLSYIAIVCSVLFVCCFAQELFKNESVYRVYSYEGLRTETFLSTEYLYYGTDINSIIPVEELVAQQPLIQEYVKDGSNIYVSISNTSEAAVDCLLPAFYYPCYTAYDSLTGEKFIVDRQTDANNIIKVMIPAGYEGDIVVKVKEPVLWMAGDCISLLFVIGACILFISKKRKIIVG